MMSVTARAIATERAREDLQLLTAHAGATATQLGAARDRLNDTYRLLEAADVHAAVTAADRIVEEVYGTTPPPRQH